MSNTPTPIDSLRSMIETAIRNQNEIFFKRMLDTFKAQPSSQHSEIGRQLLDFLRGQLQVYREQLPKQPNGVGGTIGSQTIAERDRGATDFVDFLIGESRRGGAHIRKGRPRVRK